MIWFQVLYALFCIAFAGLNAYLINKGKRIYHAVNGAIHTAAIAFGFIVFNWQTAVAILFISRLFFDWSLNLWRGLPLGYVSLAPKSIIDRLEKKAFGLNGILPKIIYLAIIIALNFI